MAEDYPVKILRVIDGDSVKVRLPDGSEQSVRMYGIDAPETAQQRGASSTKMLNQILSRGRDWRLHVIDKDHYQRLVGLIYCEDDSSVYRSTNGVGILSANHEMVRTGWAHWYKEYGDKLGEFENLERYARKEGLGVWQDDQIVYPWDFRKRRRAAGKQPKSIGWLEVFNMFSRIVFGRRSRNSLFSVLMGSSSRSSSPGFGRRKRRRKRKWY